MTASVGVDLAWHAKLSTWWGVSGAWRKQNRRWVEVNGTWRLAEADAFVAALNLTIDGTAVQPVLPQASVTFANTGASSITYSTATGVVNEPATAWLSSIDLTLAAQYEMRAVHVGGLSVPFGIDLNTWLPMNVTRTIQVLGTPVSPGTQFSASVLVQFRVTGATEVESQGLIILNVLQTEAGEIPPTTPGPTPSPGPVPGPSPRPPFRPKAQF